MWFYLHRVNPFPNKPWFLHVCSKGLLKTWGGGGGEIAHNKQFVLFHSVFIPIWKTFFYFHQIWNFLLALCIWKSLKFVIWERVDIIFGTFSRMQLEQQKKETEKLSSHLTGEGFTSSSSRTGTVFHLPNSPSKTGFSTLPSTELFGTRKALSTTSMDMGPP